MTLDPKDEVSFWTHVLKTNADGCWVWGGSRLHDGYGYVNWDGKVYRAHRIAYGFVKGPIEPGLDLDHLCRNHGCVNPAHLEPVTHAENVRRGKATKITAAVVKEIRRLYKTGVYSQRDLGRQFGIQQPQVGRITRREAWSDLPDDPEP